jgi:pimeloyl-ACP methyl ester carboxylesterase
VAATITRMLLPAPNGPLSALEARIGAAAQPVPTAVLVPGITGAKEEFLPLMELLADAGYRTFAIDQRGQHETPGVGDMTAYTIAALARDLDVAFTAAAARRPVHLLGHGLGALVAAYSCVAAPEKALSLILIGSGPEPEPAALGDDQLRGSDPRALLGMFTEAARSPMPYAGLRQCGSPVLVCTGEAAGRPAIAQCEERARELGVAADLIVGAGSSPHVDHPEALAALLVEFWSGLEPRSVAPIPHQVESDGATAQMNSAQTNTV